MTMMISAAHHVEFISAAVVLTDAEITISDSGNFMQVYEFRNPPLG